ncbi:unnamed protein product [Scytosiphon promiscuus]
MHVVTRRKRINRALPHQHQLTPDHAGCLFDRFFCPPANNNAECDYDEGDCCSCDCMDGYFYECGINGYDCVDPFSSCTYHHYYDDDSYGGSDITSVSEDDDDINRISHTVADNDGNDAGGDNAPVGIIVGGAAGGAVFLGALAVLACCIKTGRLKNCCSGGGAAGSAVPPRAQAQAPTTGYPGNGAASPPATVGTAAGPPHAQSFAPPPAYTYGGPGPAPSVQAYPISKAPPPAYAD